MCPGDELVDAGFCGCKAVSFPRDVKVDLCIPICSTS